MIYTFLWLKYKRRAYEWFFRRHPWRSTVTLSKFSFGTEYDRGGVVMSWLVHLTLDQALQVQTLAGDIVLCSWAKHFTLTVPLSTQVYNWVPVNLMLGGNPVMDWHPIQGGVEILLVTSCYGNQDKVRLDRPQLVCMQTLPTEYDNGLKNQWDIKPY